MENCKTTINQLQNKIIIYKKSYQNGHHQIIQNAVGWIMKSWLIFSFNLLSSHPQFLFLFSLRLNSVNRQPDLALSCSSSPTENKTDNKGSSKKNIFLFFKKNFGFILSKFMQSSIFIAFTAHNLVDFGKKFLAFFVILEECTVVCPVTFLGRYFFSLVFVFF